MKINVITIRLTLMELNYCLDGTYVLYASKFEVTLMGLLEETSAESIGSQIFKKIGKQAIAGKHLFSSIQSILLITDSIRKIQHVWYQLRD